MLKKTMLWLLVLVAVLVDAYEVEPMIAEIQATSGNNRVTYRVANPSETTLPLEVEVYKRSFDDNQVEQLIETDDIIVLPPQVEVAAQSYQVFRAQFIGDPRLAETQSYRIVFKQLPLKNEPDGEPEISMVFNFATLLFVNPQQGIEDLQQQLACSNPADGCELVLTNNGNQVVNLNGSQLIINTDGEQTVDWALYRELLPVSYLMPSHTIRLALASLSEQGRVQDARIELADDR
ncbi:P pilus assembly chaperone PapD [Idiomarina fontislapidosi]|uniref:Molecular chaperone n=1 Tax=Idiomarina fontislapidosi TaxID=263723 RepID=A0A432Y2C9_9GAMM|nr:fimbria/pilus periplasmic chaperone [Idiomarina fontislapidosi]PYE33253.1 P pilus assembly chaperone PapD [Idiomarina fontislapidosi]RUO55092.1 molecular chaperone [Idiomarina fontislapidosi]